MESENYWTWEVQQLKELETAKTADDVLRITSVVGNPHIAGVFLGRYFEGEGFLHRDIEVRQALEAAGWTEFRWDNIDDYVMLSPCGDRIVYYGGDIQRG
jgi:hypothetical protein